MLVKIHRVKGIVLDTNILILLAVGSFDQNQISKFKRTQNFELTDFLLLRDFVSEFKKIIVTPNVLTELSNLTDKWNKQTTNYRFFKYLAELIKKLEERTFDSRFLADKTAFVKLGLTDCSLSELGQEQLLVLTDDLELAHFLETQKLPCLNFNHIRTHLLT